MNGYLNIFFDLFLDLMCKQVCEQKIIFNLKKCCSLKVQKVIRRCCLSGQALTVSFYTKHCLVNSVQVRPRKITEKLALKIKHLLYLNKFCKQLWYQYGFSTTKKNEMKIIPCFANYYYYFFEYIF